VGLLAPAPALPLEPELPPLALPPLLELSPPPAPELPVPEDEPPEAPALELSPLDPLELSPPVAPDCSPEPELDSPEPSGELAELELAAVEVVEVVDVEVVRVASPSAVVLLGGMISGVLRGTTSAELPPPPQALRVRPASRTAAIAAIAATDRW
jgi:hypothetical protein